mgnify:CR=1 FL=1
MGNAERWGGVNYFVFNMLCYDNSLPCRRARNT